MYRAIKIIDTFVYPLILSSLLITHRWYVFLRLFGITLHCFCLKCSQILAIALVKESVPKEETHFHYKLTYMLPYYVISKHTIFHSTVNDSRLIYNPKVGIVIGINFEQKIWSLLLNFTLSKHNISLYILHESKNGVFIEIIKHSLYLGMEKKFKFGHVDSSPDKLDIQTKTSHAEPI